MVIATDILPWKDQQHSCWSRYGWVGKVKSYLLSVQIYTANAYRLLLTTLSLIGLEFNGTVNTIKVMSSWSLNLTCYTFLGQA